MKMLHLILTTSLLIAGCTTVEVPINSSFSSKDVSWFNSQGTNTIAGSAFLRTKGGDIKTCAGYDVTLLPYSDYASERMAYIYGNANEGYRTLGLQRKFEFSNESPEYSKHSKTTKCDAQGKFEFNNLPDGDYYVTTGVSWQAGVGAGAELFPEGAMLMKRLTVTGRNTKKVTLTAN